MITVEIDDREVLAALQRLVATGADLTPVYYDIGEYLVTSTKDRFAAGVAPDGTPWAPLSPVTVARKGHGKPLIGESRRLGTEIHYLVLGDGVEVGSSLEYAGTQQLGAKAKSFTGGKSPWGDIPARPFLGLSEDDQAAVLDILQEHLELALG
jgi:phage virion morphogenesis protein